MISGSSAAVAIVSATQVGKWENPSLSLAAASMDASVAVVAPSVGESAELPEVSIDVGEPLVSAASSMLGSPAIDTKLRLTTSAENVSATVGIATVTTFL